MQLEQICVIFNCMCVGNIIWPHNSGIEHRCFGYKEQQGSWSSTLCVIVECWFLQVALSGNAVPVSLPEQPR